jgi:nickel-dependent lactate racemase
MEEHLSHFALSYGHSTQLVTLPHDNVLWIVEREPPLPLPPEEALIRHALQAPWGMERLSWLVRRGQRVALVVSDITRPCPTSRLLPFVLSELRAGDVEEDDIRIVFGLGSHRCLNVAEQATLVGPAVFDRVCCGDIGSGPFVEVGRTSRGTPVQVFQPVVEADWRIYLGNIEYHYFAGYSGGAKALLPGVCSQETISANHAWMVEPGATAGRIAGNPVREDMEEAAALVGPTFLLNVVLDGQKRIVSAVAGDLTQAHRQGCRRVDELYRVPIARRADVVLASAGGWPKDINLYQAHKALENAALAVRDGGIIILLAECGEGFGQPAFAEWMTGGDAPEELLRRIREHFVLGGHKAAAIAKTLRRRVRVFLVSAMEPGLVRKTGLVPFASAQEALTAARNEMGHAASLAVMPHAGSTLPSLE